MSRVAPILANIVFARGYTLRLLDSVPVADWFRMPPGGVTHVAWQVGHLAMAQYRLALERVRGARPGDANLISESFLQLFGRDSVAGADPALYPPADEIRAVFDRVHQQLLAEVPGIPDADLDAPPLKTHLFCRTKIDCLNWCSHHEAVHAGQIGLIRRQLGRSPLW
jgi:hypothetical protein